jgi:hypothetical protein
MSTEALAALIAELPDGTVVTDPDILESYCHAPRRGDNSGSGSLRAVRQARIRNGAGDSDGLLRGGR